MTLIEPEMWDENPTYTMFLRARTRWLEEVAAYRKPSKGRGGSKCFSGSVLGTAMLLSARYFNRGADDPNNTGKAWPKYGELADRKNMPGTAKAKRERVGQDLEELAKAGFLQRLEFGKGPTEKYPRGQAAVWKMTLPDHVLADMEQERDCYSDELERYRKTDK